MRIPISQRRKGRVFWPRRSRGGLLPYTLDFTTLPDGALPELFTNYTWAILAGRAVNAPTLVANELTNPGLEGTYTAGLSPNLTKNGTPTVAEDTITPHGGTSAQSVAPAAVNDNVVWPIVVGVADTWYQISVWGKRTAGSGTGTLLNAFQTGMLPDSVSAIRTAHLNATYTLLKSAFYSATTNNIFVYPAYEVSAAGNTAIVDDGTLQKITRSSMYALANFGITDGVWKIKPDAFVDHTEVAIVIRADGATDPANCIYAVIMSDGRFPTTNGYVYLMKKVGSTTSVVLSVQAITLVADAWFEVRASGTTISVWYNGAQVSTDQTVSDAALNTGSNTYAGIFSAGGNPLKSFFASAS